MSTPERPWWAISDGEDATLDKLDRRIDEKRAEEKAKSEADVVKNAKPPPT